MSGIYSIKLGCYDRRRKINDEQRKEIVKLREEGKTYREIADIYGVSNSLVMLICNPDIAEKKKQQLAARRKAGRYKQSKEKWSAIMREHRAYKKKLYFRGLIG